MASPSLDMPPPLPDSVRSQMGPSGSPFAGMGPMMAGGPGGPPTGAPDATGALKAQADAVKKVLEKMAGSSSAGKTYFSRAIQLIDQGLKVESDQGPGTPASPQPDQAGPEGRPGMAPPASFPG